MIPAEDLSAMIINAHYTISSVIFIRQWFRYIFLMGSHWGMKTVAGESNDILIF